MTGTGMKKGTSLSASPDSFCRIPSGNAVSADASAAMNSHVLFRRNNVQGSVPDAALRIRHF